MISSMIDQVGSDVHILGVPKPSNHASAVVWEALSSDGMVGWHGGKLRVSGGSKPDRSASLAIYNDFRLNGVPSFFLDMLVSIDLEIPPAEDVVRMLDPHVLSISFDSPAFNIPEKAGVEDLAVCLAASRIAMECRELVRSETGVTADETVHSLQDVGLYALAVGGVHVYSVAKRLVRDPDFWAILDSHEGAMDFGSENDDR